MVRDYINVFWENPLKTYNKIKKYFKPIKPKFQWTFRRANDAKIFLLEAYDLMWKDKYNSPRHEFNPRIFISLFNYVHLCIHWTLGDSMDDMVYWEAALNWLYYEKNLPTAIKESTGWTQWNEETGKYEDIPFELLRDPWQKMFDNNELPKIKYNDKN